MEENNIKLFIRYFWRIVIPILAFFVSLFFIIFGFLKLIIIVVFIGVGYIIGKKMDTRRYGK
ncbi:MAG: DUF2273 domain-containing protein [Candidatus Firestonebacteria bacterium]